MVTEKSPFKKLRESGRIIHEIALAEKPSFVFSKIIDDGVVQTNNHANTRSNYAQSLFLLTGNVVGYVGNNDPVEFTPKAYFVKQLDEIMVKGV